MTYRGQLEDVPDDLIAAARAERTSTCTCAGPAPGYPQHESFCGQPEPEEDDPGSDGSLQCEQCGTTTSELHDSENYGLLCARCAYRQEERSGYGYGLSASTFGFLSETE